LIFFPVFLFLENKRFLPGNERRCQHCGAAGASRMPWMFDGRPIYFCKLCETAFVKYCKRLNLLIDFPFLKSFFKAPSGWPRVEK